MIIQKPPHDLNLFKSSHRHTTDVGRGFSEWNLQSSWNWIAKVNDSAKWICIWETGTPRMREQEGWVLEIADCTMNAKYARC